MENYGNKINNINIKDNIKGYTNMTGRINDAINTINIINGENSPEMDYLVKTINDYVLQKEGRLFKIEANGPDGPDCNHECKAWDPQHAANIYMDGNNIYNNHPDDIVLKIIPWDETEKSFFVGNLPEGGEEGVDNSEIYYFEVGEKGEMVSIID